MTKETNELDPYDRWLAERRGGKPQADLADRIMNRVADFERRRWKIWWLIAVEKIERRRMAQWVVCSGAFGIGGLPFLYLAYVAKFLTF